MKFQHMHIKTQLYLGFGVILLFVLLTGIVSYFQADQLHLQTKTLFNHPLQVRNAINELSVDILTVRVAHRDMLLSKSDAERQENHSLILTAFDDAHAQFDILFDRYLGPREDIEDAYKGFTLWKTEVEENNRLIFAGDTVKANENLRPNSIISNHRADLWTAVKVIDDFSLNKANSLFSSSEAMKDSLNLQLIGLLCLILFASLMIIFRIIRNIRKPLDQMNQAVVQFQQGDMNARIRYDYQNEFGALASSINHLTEAVQTNSELNEKTFKLSKVMLKEDEAHIFFREFLYGLAEQTGAQVAAIYLISEDQEEYVLFESLGMEGNAKTSFKAKSLEGEFGAAVLSKKVHYSKHIPSYARFTFHVTNGKFAPSEIITIPILSGRQVTSVISLSTISAFPPQALELIERNMTAMNARIGGILAYRKLLDLTAILEKQNRELDAQKTELSAQTVELTQQNAELEMQKKQLDEASRMKTNFLSNMSHELRTPLNSVIALSGVLSRRVKNLIPEEEYRYLEIIERNGKNLLSLINDVLDISRIEAGREELEINQFSVDDLISDTVSLLTPLATQKGITLQHQCLTPGLTMYSDMDKCRHILQNIIGNAIKFTEKGSVDISARESGDLVEIRISDTGIGISQENLPFIFDEFRQADSGTARRYGGTGLGLAIVKKYTELLGGSVRVKSTLHEGSEFIITLPIRLKSTKEAIRPEKQEPTFIQADPAIVPASDAKDKVILLVEDNESAIIQISDLVEEMGHSVLIAHDANEALSLIDKLIPDAMILDLMMPGIDGFELLTIMRNAEATAHIPALILTAKHITKDDLHVLKRNNIHQLIQKGDVDRLMLKNAISGMLYGKQEATLKHTQQKLSPTVFQSRPLVLVVEDNPDNMTTVKALLDDEYEVIEADNALTGIELTKERHPHLVLMDIALSGMDGIEAFNVIRNTPDLALIPVIALTASAMEHEREIILAYGFDGFIAKPIDAKEFFQKIREVLYGE